MSKSLKEIYLPAFGGAALALGLGFGLANRDYGGNKVALLEDRLSEVEAQASAAGAALSAAQEAAEAEAAKASALAAEISDAQAMAQSASLTAPAPIRDGAYGLGRAAHPDEIAAWDVDVLPDGRGLPEGRGDVYTGEEVFADQCASCHGDFAEGVDNWPVLAGGFDTLADKDPVKTVGSYWPYLSTVWDYVHRSMPFGAAQTLSDDDVYAIVAYILYSNDLVDEDFELSHENFSDVQMHNADGFVVDDRPELEYAQWRGEPCMTGCKDSVTITMRATFLDVTPEDGGESVMNHASTSDTPTFTAAVSDQSADTGSDAATPAEAPAEAVAALDPALVAAGEKVFRKCQSCHQVGPDAENKSGPHLTGVVGRPFAAADGFRYSPVLTEAAEAGRVWDEAELAGFLTKPKDYLKGTRMSFAGLKKEADIAALIAYLRSMDG